jgi:hypothetical protein
VRARRQSPDARRRAGPNQGQVDTLESYEPPPIDPARDEAVRDEIG